MPHLIKFERAIDFTEENLVSLDQYQALANQHSSELPKGIRITENESVIAANLNLDSIDIIVFEFAKFADGRAFSEARILRDTHNYQGDIRASGDFMPDQVSFLKRTGFSSFSCRSEQEKNTALEILELVTAQYQSDTLEKRPSFRR
jgi:uncharacterized protein (DUF934 family)